MQWFNRFDPNKFRNMAQLFWSMGMTAHTHSEIISIWHKSMHCSYERREQWMNDGEHRHKLMKCNSIYTKYLWYQNHFKYFYFTFPLFFGTSIQQRDVVNRRSVHSFQYCRVYVCACECNRFFFYVWVNNLHGGRNRIRYARCMNIVNYKAVYSDTLHLTPYSTFFVRLNCTLEYWSGQCMHLWFIWTEGKASE